MRLPGLLAPVALVLCLAAGPAAARDEDARKLQAIAWKTVRELNEKK